MKYGFSHHLQDVLLNGGHEVLALWGLHSLEERETLTLGYDLLVSRGLLAPQRASICDHEVVAPGVFWWSATGLVDGTLAVRARDAPFGRPMETVWRYLTPDVGAEALVPVMRFPEIQPVYDRICRDVKRRTKAALRRGLDPFNPEHREEIRRLDEWVVG